MAEVEVRSDFQITAKLWRRSGAVETVGQFAHQHVRSMWTKVAIPHLHRLDSSKKWLAFYDQKHARIELRRAAGGAVKRISIKGGAGPVKVVRWLGTSDGLVLASAKRVFVAAFSPNRPPAKLTLVEVPIPEPAARVVRDVRTMPSGLMVLTGRALYFVPTRSGSASKPVVVRAAERGGFISSASVLAGSRVVAVVWHKKRHELHMFSVRGGHPRALWKRRCKKGRCSVANWTPHSRALAYIRHGRKYARLVVWEKGLKSRRRTVALKARAGELAILWANPRESAYLVGDQTTLRLIGASGKQRWSWTAPGRRRLHSAFFQPDGSVVAAAGLSIYSIRDGKHRLLLTIKGAYSERQAGPHSAKTTGKNSYSFVDQPVRLADGSIAFSLVDVSEARRRH